MDNLLLIGAFTLIFSLFDYFGYNISARKGWVNEKLVNPYRTSQTIVQILLIISAWYFFGWLVALGFTLLWWSWVCDWFFYFIGEILGIYGRGHLKNEPMSNIVSWSWWTWWGLLFHKGNKEYKFKSWELIVQSIIGIIITILLCGKVF